MAIIFDKYIEGRSSTENLTSIGNQNLGIHNTFGLVDTNFLVKNESFIEVRVCQFSTNFLDNLDMVQIR
jgi:hypothetical protein